MCVCEREREREREEKRKGEGERKVNRCVIAKERKKPQGERWRKKEDEEKGRTRT